MKIEFVEDSVVEQLSLDLRRSPLVTALTDTIEELYKNPNRWAKLAIKWPSSSQIYISVRKFKDVEVRLSGGNNLKKHDPDKRDWDIYLRFSPKPGPKSKK